MLEDLEEINKTAAQELNHLDEPNKIKLMFFFGTKGKPDNTKKKLIE